ncbi:hypothetical protein GCM10010305_14490 [Streptomyces termitum]|uniref:Uncharacterized protein n=1 Tax=Streptomyces termitum TaxID=67368 RepID=A0A918W560_9ACTN|nr:hypothetical protein GCM10010305_14490 [Streptomyces termitum]
MDDDVGAAQLLGDGRIAHVEDVPPGLLHLAAPLVDGEDLPDLLRIGESPGQKGSDAGGGAGDRDDGPARGGPG